METVLEANFSEAMDGRLRWLNPPPRWSVGENGRGLVVETGAATDFWQGTHYGFRVDNGHVLAMELAGDFTVMTQLSFRAVHQYDQAGLIIRKDADCWIKTSVEHEQEGPPQLGVVVTSHGFSDWSLQNFPSGQTQVHLRLSKRAQDLTAEWKVPAAEGWTLMRVAHWHAPAEAPVWAGLYACSPKGAGFQAEFFSLQIMRPG